MVSVSAVIERLAERRKSWKDHVLIKSTHHHRIVSYTLMGIITENNGIMGTVHKKWHPAQPSRHTTSYDVSIRLDLGRDVRWPKFNVKPTSNDNVNLTSKTDVSWRWYFVVFRLCCKVTKIQRRANVSSQRHIDVKYWYLIVRYGNQNPTSSRRHNGNVHTTSNS